MGCLPGYCLLLRCFLNLAMKSLYSASSASTLFSGRDAVVVDAFGSSSDGGLPRTRYSGRMEPLPDWIHKGAIVHAQGGTGKASPFRPFSVHGEAWPMLTHGGWHMTWAHSLPMLTHGGA